MDAAVLAALLSDWSADCDKRLLCCFSKMVFPSPVQFLSPLPQIKVSFSPSMQISIEFVTFPAGAHNKPTCSTAGDSVVKFAKSFVFLHHVGVLLNRRKGRKKKKTTQHH